MAQSVFDSFTNLYELNKTLRFELRPVGNTQQMLEDNKIFAEDEKKKNAYKKIKPYFDRLHKEFVDESLRETELQGLDIYFDLWKEWKKDKKNTENQKKFDIKRKELRKQVVSYFNATGGKWAEIKYAHLNIKQKDLGILFEKEIFAILKDHYGTEPEAQLVEQVVDTKTGEIKEEHFSMFDVWDGFAGYFRKFHETRRNFYKDDGTSTSLATRIIDQNLDRFLENIQLFESIKMKLDISEVEKYFQKSAKTVFSLEFYNFCVLQKGIDGYNDFLGGKTLEDGTKKIGLNELINQYRQQHTGEKLLYFKKLDKQILNEKEKKIFVLETNEECFSVLEEFQKNAETKILLLKKIVNDFVNNTKNYNLKTIYISKEAFNTISRKWTNETTIFEEKISEILTKEKLMKTKKKNEEEFSFPDFIALEHLKNALEKIIVEGKFWKERYYADYQTETGKGFLMGNVSLWDGFFQILNYEFQKNFISFDTTNSNIKKIFSQENKNLQTEKFLIKEFADSVLWTYQLGKYFAVEKKRIWLSEYELDDFYTKPDIGYLAFYEDAYKQIVQAYNDIRNYLTKKPYSEEKWKLNFENPTLADGWDKNKESDNSAVILRKNGKYFLGLMKKSCNKIFDERNTNALQAGIENGNYEKMVYKLFPDPAKMMPKVCFSAKGLDFFKPSEEIFCIYKNEEFKKGDSFSVESMQKLIYFYENCLSKYEGWKCYEFRNIKSPKAYQNNIGEFYSDISKNGYKIEFEKVSESYIEQKNKNGELYLFEIYNQDFAQGKTGKQNLHTMYWEELFSSENTKEFLFKLNGQAEVFYRPKSIEIEMEKRNFPREITKNKRYTTNKIFFHCPITLNREKGEARKFNKSINDFLSNNKDINIIGVDRGEKHLAYYSVINQQQKILESGSLNDINGVNYGTKLEEKAGVREQNRKDWQAVETIKDLKKGYISQVVRKLADLAIKHNAIIIFEDLNMRFKQIRGGIEKSVYQQLEKALIEKLSFLVNKGEMDSTKAGHLLRAYQLTAPIEAFKDMGKQTGIIFYTQAAYTSKIDPLTGWRPSLYLKYSNAEKTKEDILKFIKIEFNKEKDSFEFIYDLKNFAGNKKSKNKEVEFPKKTEWILCSCVERFRWNKNLNNNKGGYEHYQNLTENFQKLFNEFKINIERNILEQIQVLEPKGNEKFFKDFIFFFSLVCQIRNTQKEKEGNENDFILSPVSPFFDSRKADQFGANLPKNGDDNGAYNIARKGIMILEKISAYKSKNGNCEKLGWGELSISNAEWDNFAQNSHL